MVGYSSSTGKYQATLNILGKLIFLGEYQSYKEAKLAEKSAIHDSDYFYDRRLTVNHTGR
jgi:hypothetical protein